MCVALRQNESVFWATLAEQPFVNMSILGESPKMGRGLRGDDTPC
jgi:hypothetical protein